MSKKVIRLTESELKQYIRKIVLEQRSPDYYMDPEQNPERYAAADQPTNSTPKQTGEPIVPYEMKGPSAPTSSISPDDLAKSIAGIEKYKKGAQFLQFIKTYGHTSKESWDAAIAGGYVPYTSPQLKAKAQKERYFPYTNMDEKIAADKKNGAKAPQRPTLKFNPNPNLSFEENVKKTEQYIRRPLTPNERAQISAAYIKSKSNLNQRQPPPPQGQKFNINEQVSNEGAGQECYRFGEVFVCVGETSDYVKDLQKQLNQSKCQNGLPPITVDGTFGPETKQRIQVNQKSNCKVQGFDVQQYKKVKTPTGFKYVPKIVSGKDLN